MEHSIEIMKNCIVDILVNNKPSIYLYGSVILNDFKRGWSDIDILCLTHTKVTDKQANRLLNLRQELQSEYGEMLCFSSFEGGFLTLDSFINGNPDTVVYWGTSGQRITERHYFDPFSMIELIELGRLIYGDDLRDRFAYPTKIETIEAIIEHYNAIRKYAVTTEKSIYSAGWLLDIARCIYTLKTGKIIAKTKAGRWALDNNIAPDIEIMKKVIEIREEPERFIHDNETMEWSATLGKYIQRFADVLEKEISISNR